MKIIHQYTGKSLNELHKEYGIGSSGFYSTDPWWKNEKFADKKMKARKYELTFDGNLKGKTYKEQKKSVEKVPHPAIVAEAILSHFKKTGERLLEDWYVRTASFDRDGYFVLVGRFDATGLFIRNVWDGRPDNFIGLASFRKIK